MKTISKKWAREVSKLQETCALLQKEKGDFGLNKDVEALAIMHNEDKNKLASDQEMLRHLESEVKYFNSENCMNSFDQ